MKLHANAPFGPKGRGTMVGRVIDEGWSLTQAAEAAGVSERTCSKWVARYRLEGEDGLVDRSAKPARVPHRTPQDRGQAIAALRRRTVNSGLINRAVEKMGPRPYPLTLSPYTSWPSLTDRRYDARHLGRWHLDGGAHLRR